MERTKRIRNFLSGTGKKCPRKHSTSLRLYIIYKAWSVLPGRHGGKTGKKVRGGNAGKASVKTVHFAPCIYNGYKAWSVPPRKPEMR